MICTRISSYLFSNDPIGNLSVLIWGHLVRWIMKIKTKNIHNFLRYSLNETISKNPIGNLAVLIQGMASWVQFYHTRLLTSIILSDRPYTFPITSVKLECGTWYHHPRRQQCVLGRNLRIFKVATSHCRCRYHLKNDWNRHDLQGRIQDLK